MSKVNEEGEQVVVKETSFRRELLTKCQKEFEKLDEEREAKLQAIEEASSVSGDRARDDDQAEVCIIDRLESSLVLSFCSY